MSENHSDLEEATFKLQGIIIKKDLPPIPSPRYDNKFIHYFNMIMKSTQP